MNTKKIVGLLILMFMNSSLWAESFTICENRYIDEMFINGERADSQVEYSNKLILTLVDENGASDNCLKKHVHIDNSKAVYNSIFSAALAAQTMGKKVSLYVHPSKVVHDSVEIAILALAKD